MWHLYILESSISGRHYIGITENIQERLAKHNKGSVRSTKAYRPWKLLYRKPYSSRKDARIREIELKKNGYKRLALSKKVKVSALSSIG